MNPAIIHRLKYYIGFFSDIPEKHWCSGSLSATRKDQRVTHCALGHLGVTHLGMLNAEAKELTKLLHPLLPSDYLEHDIVPVINDGRKPTYICHDHLLPTLERLPQVIPGSRPKTRILRALKKRLEMETKTNEPACNSPAEALP